MKDNPKILYVRVSENCNSKCFMCHYAGKHDSYNITTEQYDELLEYVKTRHFKMIRFTGGEPLLHRNIIDFIKKAKNLDLQTSIITNGYLLRMMSKKLVEAGLDQCIISLDGSCSDIHDNLRNFKGCFDNIIFGIQELRKYNKLIKIRINTVVSGRNIMDITNIYKLLLKLHVNQWSIIPVKYKDNIWIPESFKYYDEFQKEIKNNDDKQLEFLGDSKIFAGISNEEIFDTFNNNKRIKSKNICSVIDYVRFYIPDKNLLVPCNCIAHRLNQIPVTMSGDMECDCEKIRKWLKLNCSKCTGCEPLNVYINDNPEIMLDEENIRY